MPTQLYDAPSREVGKRFVGILSVELGGVRSRKWNTERVLIFQYIILKILHGVNNSAQIRKRILFRLDFWNHGALDELVKDTYNSALGYLGKSLWSQTE